MASQLHDETDRTEDVIIKSRELVRRVRDKLPDASELAGDPRSALLLIAALVEEESVPLTTEAFKLGVEFAKERENLG